MEIKRDRYINALKKNNDQGFTLAELIVVLVILTILAAILVPSLLGYIDKSKSHKNMLAAKNCLTAAQGVMTELYAAGYSPGVDDADSAGKNGNGDVKWSGKPNGKKILDLADDDPYVLIIGCGQYNNYKDTDIHKAFTVYFVGYMKDKNSKPIYFDGKDWITDYYPWSKNDTDNTFNGVKLQIYEVANKSGKAWWKILPDKSGYKPN